ncbi:MAG: amino acid--tRNA ligase-related protein [bacterium]
MTHSTSGQPNSRGRNGAGDGPGDVTQGDARRWSRRVGADGSGPSRMELLALRHRLLRAVRGWFDAQGFLEADTPSLLRAPSPEAVFAPFAAGDGWLGASPEFQLKRMLVGGFKRIYRLGPAFRAGEAGLHHNPEFTLLEWYRVFPDPGAETLPTDHSPMNALAAGLEELLGEVAPIADTAAGLWPPGPVRERLIATSRALRASPWRRAAVGELFAEYLNMNITGVTAAQALADTARKAGVNWSGREEESNADFTAVFSALWIDIERKLPPEPLLVTGWPAPMASLARLKPGDPTLAERMELYCGGLELANGFFELTDPAEQRRRFEADLAQRRAKGLPAVPLDEAFLAALEEGLPPAVGMALGLDRLAMLLSGAPHIRDVLPFGWDER